MLRPEKKSTFLSAGSLRASRQLAKTHPVDGSTVIHGLNWLFVPVSSLTRKGEVQVAPWSDDVKRKISKSGLDPLAGMSSYAIYSLPRFGPALSSTASTGSTGIPRPGCGGIKWRPAGDGALKVTTGISVPKEKTPFAKVVDTSNIS